MDGGVGTRESERYGFTGGRGWVARKAMRLAGLAFSTLAALLLLAPVVAAQQGFELYVEPKTDGAREIQSLFNITLAIAAFVFIFVQGLLFFTIWKFRNNKTPPKETGHRGHTTAEVVWTAIPAAILLLLGGISAQTLFVLDTVPDDVTTVVKVDMFQWGFKYTYPDGNTTFNDLYLQEGERVELQVTATDVIHALWIPAFGIKIDGVPGRVNPVWFDTPGPGTYFLQCAEYCYTGHHAMQGNVIVFAKDTQPLPYGKPPKA